MSRRAIGVAFVALCAALSLPATSKAQGTGERTIRIIVPFAAGGGVDTFGRLIAQKLQDKLGANVVVENRGGANGTLGGSAVMQAAPDGSTLLFSASTHVTARLVMSKAPYDPLADFTPVARVGQTPLLVVISPKRPQNTLAEVVADAKRDPTAWTAATAALGSPGHLGTIALGNLTGIKPTVVLYRGTAPALNDVAGGHVQMLVDAMVALLPLAQTGGVKGLAITGDKRSKLAPEIPTAAESGVPGLTIFSWYGVWGPKGMAPELVSQLNATIAAATRELAAEGKLDSLGIEPVVETPEAFARFTSEEVARSAALLKSVDFQPN